MAIAAASKVFLKFIGDMLRKHSVPDVLKMSQKYKIPRNIVNKAIRQKSGADSYYNHNQSIAGISRFSKLPKSLQRSWEKAASSAEKAASSTKTFAQRKLARTKSMEKARILGGGRSDRQRMAEYAGTVDPNTRLRKGVF